ARAPPWLTQEVSGHPIAQVPAWPAWPTGRRASRYWTRRGLPNWIPLCRSSQCPFDTNAQENVCTGRGTSDFYRLIDPRVPGRVPIVRPKPPIVQSSVYLELWFSPASPRFLPVCTPILRLASVLRGLVPTRAENAGEMPRLPQHALSNRMKRCWALCRTAYCS